ncbi:hypothetical protein Pmar_PMAR014899 [Perkinsus marinus ATCC 50983]|uniref:Uncharacterized protein n=1 Tax=Perkinsus marinus (strain ATCC 50983 / TXsc) TaxID=423536 RepID=C5L576_PERM5|nr:hypothetical protein Pmar_PMAR014899 [Perkinsus marinus ATCC 50983]EER08135.1 hypothetical protein Pmar_PMAR014899 [Perkinsus marinus ATCC 50983]|eukprot:XP_002776319.1 hypothetical protein Pmar_PMAR014899 [Perkinsus marinus ATCC 50983]
MHGRELKLKRLEEIESKRKRTFEETVEELRSAQSKASATPAPAEGEEAVLSKREQFRLKIVSPSVRELVEAAHERARLPRSHRKLVHDYGRSDKRVRASTPQLGVRVRLL